MYDIIYDGTSAHSNNVANILVESESDLTNLPDTIAAGSIAYTAGFAYMWQKSISGTWVAI